MTEAMFNAIAAIANLSHDEQVELFAFLHKGKLSQPEREPSPAIEAKDHPQKRHPNANRKWSDEETLALLDYMEDAEIMSPKERMRKKRLLAKVIGRSVKAVENRASEIKCGRAK
jgi:hypothetical protein